MATRTRRLPAPVVTRHRPSMTINGRTVYGPQSTTTTTTVANAATGAHECTTTTQRDERQRPIVGSLVTLDASRRSRASVAAAEYSRMTGSEGSPYGHHIPLVWTGSYGCGYVYVVDAISADGKLLACRQVVRPLHQFRTPVSATMVPVRTTYPHPLPDDQAGPPSPFYTVDEMVSGICHSAVARSPADRGPVVWARATHIDAHMDPNVVAPCIWDALRRFSSRNVARTLYARLAGLETSSRAHWRNVAVQPTSNHFRYREMRAQRVSSGRAVAEQVYNLRVAVACGRATGTNMDQFQAAAAGLSRGPFRRLVANAMRPFAGTQDADAVSVADCGHVHLAGNTTTLRDGTTLCRRCASRNAVRAYDTTESPLPADAQPVVVDRRHQTTYTWSDGTTRTAVEPRAIHPRHSGKGVVGFVPSISGTSRAAMLTCGLELEIQSVRPEERNAQARAIHARLTTTPIPAAMRRKYMHMEEDGSTGEGGFEVVTGYTDLATHAAVLKTLLCNPDGSNAWSGKLLGHDSRGQACGIHVHVQKPRSLIHAMKIRQLVNSRTFEPLIHAVARRSGNSFCQYDERNATAAVDQAVEVYKREKRSYTSPADTQRTALMRINAQTRYEAVNFQNAATVEFRMFRSSTRYETVMACMELACAIWRFTAVTKGENMTRDAFLRFLERTEQRADTRNLRTYLNAKGFSVAVPNPNKRAAVAVLADAAESV